MIYDYRGNSALSGQPKSYEKANGTITTDVNTTFNGTSKSSNTDNFDTLHTDAIRKSTEDSTYETGWSDGSAWSLLLGSGEWKGQKLTQTVKGHGSEHLQSDVESGELIITGDPNGTVGYTDMVTIVSWSYDVDDADNYAKFDRTWVSTLTNNAGLDQDNNPWHSQSLVETWDMTDLIYSKTYDEGSTAFSEYTIETTDTDVTTDRGVHSQINTLSGPPDKRKATLGINFDSTHTNAHTVEEYKITDSEVDLYDHEERTTTTVTSDFLQNTSTYRSSHTVGSQGEAIDGQFGTHGSSTHKTQETTSIVIDGSWEAFFGGNHGVYYADDEDTQSTRVYGTFFESGTYYDQVTGNGVGARIQTGTYVRSSVTAKEDLDWDDHNAVTYYADGSETEAWYGNETKSDETKFVGFEGSYDATGQQETTRDWRTSTTRTLIYDAANHTTPGTGDFWWWWEDVEVVTISVPVEGEAHGTINEGFWSNNYSETSVSVFAPTLGIYGPSQ